MKNLKTTEKWNKRERVFITFFLLISSFPSCLQTSNKNEETFFGISKTQANVAKELAATAFNKLGVTPPKILSTSKIHSTHSNLMYAIPRPPILVEAKSTFECQSTDCVEDRAEVISVDARKDYVLHLEARAKKENRIDEQYLGVMAIAFLDADENPITFGVNGYQELAGGKKITLQLAHQESAFPKYWFSYLMDQKGVGDYLKFSFYFRTPIDAKKIIPLVRTTSGEFLDIGSIRLLERNWENSSTVFHSQSFETNTLPAEPELNLKNILALQKHKLEPGLTAYDGNQFLEVRAQKDLELPLGSWFEVKEEEWLHIAMVIRSFSERPGFLAIEFRNGLLDLLPEKVFSPTLQFRHFLGADRVGWNLMNKFNYDSNSEKFTVDWIKQNQFLKIPKGVSHIRIKLLRDCKLEKRHCDEKLDLDRMEVKRLSNPSISFFKVFSQLEMGRNEWVQVSQELMYRLSYRDPTPRKKVVFWFDFLSEDLKPVGEATGQRSIRWLKEGRGWTSNILEKDEESLLFNLDFVPPRGARLVRISISDPITGEELPAYEVLNRLEFLGVNLESTQK